MKTRIDSLLRRDPAEVQGAVFVVSGLWPLVHLRSFTWVTGPKPEGWLVKTVGGLLSVIGATLLSAHRKGRVTPEIRKLAAWSSLSLLAIDVFYVAKRRISPIYLGDAALEAALAAWQWSTLSRASTATSPARSAATPSEFASDRHGRWDILPGETLDANGKRDKVAEGSMASFPASDPPAYMG